MMCIKTTNENTEYRMPMESHKHETYSYESKAFPVSYENIAVFEDVNSVGQLGLHFAKDNIILTVWSM